MERADNTSRSGRFAEREWRMRTSGSKVMATKITRDVLESYLHCKTKAHLKLAGQQGSVSDYEGLLVASRQEVRQTGHRQDPRQAPRGRGGEGHPPDRRRPAGRSVVRAGRHPGRRPAVAPLRRAEEGGWAIEAGGLPLRPDAKGPSKNKFHVSGKLSWTSTQLHGGSSPCPSRKSISASAPTASARSTHPDQETPPADEPAAQPAR